MKRANVFWSLAVLCFCVVIALIVGDEEAENERG